MRPPEARDVSKLALIRRVIEHVPRGKVITYGQAAAAAGFPGAARLTVRALYRAIGLPWHRVVAAGGRIALIGEDGQEQRLRLSVEGVTFRGGRVRMDRHGWIPRSRKGHL
jgi:methylated-DNA-protein-cysteine methyltransferase related protein